jgi:hypothetical protein
MRGQGVRELGVAGGHDRTAVADGAHEHGDGHPGHRGGQPGRPPPTLPPDRCAAEGRPILGQFVTSRGVR